MQSDHDVTAAMMPNSDMNRIVAKGEDIMSSQRDIDEDGLPQTDYPLVAQNLKQARGMSPPTVNVIKSNTTGT